MFTQDLQIINDVRLLSLHAREVYEYLAQRVCDQQSRNVLKRLARHRKEIVNAITSEEAATDQCEMLSQFVPENIRDEIGARDIASDSIETLIARERLEIGYLRNEVKRIRNYVLRRRLSSHVATLQMDFDQLQSLIAVPKTVTKGDGNE